MSLEDLPELPKECLSHILSLMQLNVYDVLQFSTVSKQFLLASESDVVWAKFFPLDCDRILSQSSTSPEHFTSKKNLFLHLCRSHILFNNNTESYGLNIKSGIVKKHYMLGARALEINWGDTIQYWTWESILESRFPEVAVLQDVCWLYIRGKIDTSLLSPNTSYGAYFVFKIDADMYRGFEATPVKVCVYEVNQNGSSENHQHAVVVKDCYLKVPEGRRRPRRPSDHPIERDDGWMEVEMGKYQVGVDCGGVKLEMMLREVEELQWKSGIIVQGIEIRPLD